MDVTQESRFIGGGSGSQFLQIAVKRGRNRGYWSAFGTATQVSDRPS